MNCQSYPNLTDEEKKQVNGLLKKHIDENCVYTNTEYIAYSMTYSSTSGARKGIGGCAMSNFTTHAFCIDSSAVLLCTGIAKFIERFEPFRSRV